MLADIVDEFGPLYVLAVLAALALAVVGLAAGWASRAFVIVGISVPGWPLVALFGVLGVLGVVAAVVRVRA